MILKHVQIEGKPFDLGRKIGKGGEGEIYLLQNAPSLALKVYTTQDRMAREQKISAMVNLNLAKKSSLVAFPISIARTKDGMFVGFVMRLVADHTPLHELYSPGARKKHFPHADYRFLVRTATNVARAVASVHQAGCVIGDINHSSMLISSKAVVALIDADSFQIATSSEQFLCKVGVPEYTPPELQGKNFGSTIRTQNHDAFGLAIVIFQILFMGRHPFVGTVRSGDIPPLHENIKNYKYVYTDTRNVGMDQPPGTPDINDFSPKLASTFEAAFSKAGADKRPTAQDWVNILERLESTLVKCDDNSLHFIPKDASECAWCEMEKVLSITLFVPYIPGAAQYDGRDPGVLSFNIENIWKGIEALSLPSQIQPRLSNPALGPSNQALEAKELLNSFNFGILFVVGAVIGCIALPAFFWIWLIVGWLGYSSSNEKKTIDPKPFLLAYEEATKRWDQELDNWNQITGVKSFLSLKKELSDAKSSYLQLVEEERRLIQNFRIERRNKHLNAFLDTFYIGSAKIKGISFGREAILASYGIDTAADISRSKLQNLPGFGEATAKPLLTWRESLEKRFVYQANETDFDRRELSRIRASVESKLSPLRQKLSVGQTNLSSLLSRISAAIKIDYPSLNQSNARREQAKVDLEFLGISVPPAVRTPSYRSAPQPTINPYGTPSPKPTTTISTNCPRCGSKMIKRMARRGRNAGNYFWGCTRYPVCKGTRNI